MEGGHPKYVQVRTGEGYLKNWSQDKYVLNRSPQTNFVEYFYGLVRSNTLEHDRQQKKRGYFFPS